MGQTEEALITRIQRLFPSFKEGIGIGDDAAIVEARGEIVITTDMLLEGIDFTLDIPMGFIGAKALTANISDLAAMGAIPKNFLLTLAMPPDSAASIDPLLYGLRDAASKYEVKLIGGDLSSGPCLIISITAIGAMDGARPLLRSGAQAGDRLYVSRPLGASATGLHLTQSGWKVTAEGNAVSPSGYALSYTQREFAASVLRRHVSPEAEVALGRKLATAGLASSCIDVSDGLSTDLQHLCRASRCGARIQWDRLPVFPDLPQLARPIGISVDEVVLHGGEEYSLLFTSPLRESELSQRLSRPVYQIGTIVKGSELTIVRDEKEEPLEVRGYDHFA
ncbi:MAG TPA: thiamine-phosphate kinase [Thermoanaerobaculia bacterium]|nr:thiamine-phosphate kinase [Thermoanaerobaculia bacterium]